MAITKLKGAKGPLVRETDVHERTFPIVVELQPRYETVRLKGTQESYNVPYDVLLDWLRKREYKRKAS